MELPLTWFLIQVLLLILMINVLSLKSKELNCISLQSSDKCILPYGSNLQLTLLQENHRPTNKFDTAMAYFDQ